MPYLRATNVATDPPASGTVDRELRKRTLHILGPNPRRTRSTDACLTHRTGMSVRIDGGIMSAQAARLPFLRQ